MSISEKERDDANAVAASNGGSNEDARVGRTKTQIFERSVKAPSLTCIVLISSDTQVLPRGKVYSISFSSLVESGNLRPVTIGRNSECDVVLQCNSVSNHHAKLHWYNNNFFLTDDHSSNGTHVYLRQPLKVEKGKEIVIR